LTGTNEHWQVQPCIEMHRQALIGIGEHRHHRHTQKCIRQALTGIDVDRQAEERGQAVTDSHRRAYTYTDRHRGQRQAQHTERYDRSRCT
jgi:translation initiation factor 2 gamma subunit (eIF-2gamma)